MCETALISSGTVTLDTSTGEPQLRRRNPSEDSVITRRFPVDVVFEAFGPDVRIHDFDRLTKRRGGSKEKTGRRRLHIQFMLGSGKDERAAIRVAERWLKKNFRLVRNLNARKIIELRTMLEESMASKIFILEPSFLELMSSANCALWHQYSHRQTKT